MPVAKIMPSWKTALPSKTWTTPGVCTRDLPCAHRLRLPICSIDAKGWRVRRSDINTRDYKRRISVTVGMIPPGNVVSPQLSDVYHETTFKLLPSYLRRSSWASHEQTLLGMRWRRTIEP